MPETAFISVTSKCNSRCLMCDIWRNQKPVDISLDVLEKLPSSLKSIDITGGEPFLYPNLTEILRTLKKTCPSANFLITTNGFLTGKIKEEVSKMLGFEEKMAIRVSLDGREKNHDKIRGIKGAFAKVIKTLVVLKRLGVKDLGVIFTLMEQNKRDIEKVLDFCRKEKLQFSLNLIHDSPVYFGQKHLLLRPNLSDTQKATYLVRRFFWPSINPKNLAKAWFYQHLVNYQKTGKRPIKCGAGQNFFYLDPRGEVYLCHFQNWKIGNLEEQSFSEIWEEEKRKKFLNLAENCHQCFMICTVRDEVKKGRLQILKEMVHF